MNWLKKIVEVKVKEYVITDFKEIKKRFDDILKDYPSCYHSFREDYNFHSPDKMEIGYWLYADLREDLGGAISVCGDSWDEAFQKFEKDLRTNSNNKKLVKAAKEKLTEDELKLLGVR